MKVYIAGKITGDPNYREKFERYAGIIKQSGHIPLSPAVIPDGLPLSDCMRICFAMIDSADMVYFIQDCKDSPGARLELMYCKYIGKPVSFFK